MAQALNTPSEEDNAVFENLQQNKATVLSPMPSNVRPQETENTPSEEDNAAFENSGGVTHEDTQGDFAQIPPIKTTTEHKTELAPEKEKAFLEYYGEEVAKGLVRGVPSAIAELLQTIGDIDEASKSYLGTFQWEDRGKKGYDLADLFQIPDYLSGSEYEKQKEIFKAEHKEANMLYDLSNYIDTQVDKGFGTTDSIVGGLAEAGTQFGTGFGLVNKLFKLGSYGYKGMFLGEAIVGATFFDPEESLITNVVSPYLKAKFNDMTDLELEAWMAEEAEKAKENPFVERGKLAAEAVTFVGVIQAVPMLFRAIKGKKIAIEDAKLEQQKNGKVSNETLERIDANGKIIAENAEEAGKAIENSKPKKKTLAKAKKISDNVLKLKAKTEEVKQKKRKENSVIVKSETKMHNELIEEFEDNLTVNKNKIRGDEDYVSVTTVKGGKRFLDPKKLEEAKNRSISQVEQKDQSYLQTGQDPRMPQSIYLEKGIEDKYDMEELFDRVLKVDNIEALTVVAKHLRDANPSAWKATKRETYRDGKTGRRRRRTVKKTVMENIFDSVVNGKFTLRADHPLWDALDKAGMSFEDFTLMHLGSASVAGKTLNKYSQLARKVKPKSLKQQEELEEMLRNQSRTAQWFRRVENVRRGLLVSQIATAARNLESGLLRTPIEALNNIVETATTDIANGNFFGGQNRLLKGTTWTDAFAGMRYIYADRKTAKEFNDLLLGDPNNPDLVAHPKLQEFADRMFNTINEIQLSTGRGSNTTFDRFMSRAEDFTQLLNRPNRWQDFMLRRGMFMGEAQRLFRNKWGIDLEEQLKNGRLEDILNDAKDLNPTFKSTIDPKTGKEVEGLSVTANEIFAEATERALDLTYANPPESPFGKAFANFITKYNLTVLVPFPRFMAKSMELMAENSVGALMPVVRRMYGHTGYGAKKFGQINPRTGKREVFGLTQREHRMIARNTTGALGIMGASYMLKETDQQGEDYKLIPVGDGTVLDVTPLFPLRQFFFLGKMVNEFSRARQDAGWMSGGREAFFSTFDRREWAETFIGTSFRTGVAGNLVDEAASLFNSQDITNDEWWAKNGGQMLGDYFSSFAVPMNQVIDLQRGLGQRGLAYKETGKDPEIVDAGGAFIEGITKPFRRYDPFGVVVDESALPKKEDPFQEERRRVAPLAKVALGLNMYTADSEEGKIMKSLGFDKWDVSSRSRIPSVKNFENKLIRQHLPAIAHEAQTIANVWGERYDDKREELSSRGISREYYIKDNARQYIKTMIDMFRDPDNAVVAIDDPTKVMGYKVMTDYRRLSTDQRNKGWYRFVEEENREPFEMNQQSRYDLYHEWDELSDKEKATVLKGIKLRDMTKLYTYGKESP